MIIGEQRVPRQFALPECRRRCQEASAWREVLIQVLRNNKNVRIEILVDRGVPKCVKPQVGNIERRRDRPHQGVNADHKELGIASFESAKYFRRIGQGYLGHVDVDDVIVAYPGRGKTDHKIALSDKLTNEARGVRIFITGRSGTKM